jgi:FdhD protein
MTCPSQPWEEPVDVAGPADASPQVAVTLLREGAAGAPQHRRLIQEQPLVITLNWATEYALMRTPGHDQDLAYGFLFTEGLIRGPEDVLFMRPCESDRGVLDVATAEVDVPEVRRTLTVNSACGLCGRMDLERLLESLAPLEDAARFAAQVLYDLPGRILAHQTLFQATGASHAVALFGSGGEVQVLREDVGRHNAFDKAIGHCLRAGQTMASGGAFLSGRASLEMLIKAARARIPLVVAVSAPTEAAVRIAERLNITLCGFLRGREITVYSHPERILPDPAMP